MTRKTITHYLTDLRLDLKDSGALWSDAELTRSVEKAVADYSRFFPREMSTELTVDAEVTGESFTTPTVSDPDYFVDDKDISSITDGETCTLAARTPDVPRPVMVTVTDGNASITDFVIIVKGRDTGSNYIEESFYLAGGLVQTGVQYFATVTEVEIDYIVGEGTDDKLDVGTGSADGVYVQLANKSIKFGTDAITNKKLDTDYELDYHQGRIAMKDGGSLTASTAYTIVYTKSRITVDLSTVIEEFIAIVRVEYPSGTVPQQFTSPDIWGTTMTIAGNVNSQVEASDAEHLVIRYTTRHSPPSAQSAGTYPSHMDTTVELAAAGYSLLIKALQYEHQAVLDFASARTELGLTTAVHTLVAAALAKVITYMEDNTNEDAVTHLTKITTDIADLRTAIATALDDAAVELGEVTSISLDKATTGAEGLLDTGDDFINAINDGARVPENYREYSQTRAAISQARFSTAGIYIQEATVRLNNLNSYISQAMDGWSGVARAFMEEAAGQLGEIDRHLAEALQFQQIAAQNLVLADRFSEEAIVRRDEAWAIWTNPHAISQTYSRGNRGQPA